MKSNAVESPIQSLATELNRVHAMEAHLNLIQLASIGEKEGLLRELVSSNPSADSEKALEDYLKSAERLLALTENQFAVVKKAIQHKILKYLSTITGQPLPGKLTLGSKFDGEQSVYVQEITGLYCYEDGSLRRVSVRSQQRDGNVIIRNILRPQKSETLFWESQTGF